MRLYELTAEMAAIDAAIEEAGGELSPDLEAALDRVTGGLAEKVDAVVSIMRQAKADSEAYKAEAAFFTAKATVAKNKHDRLADYLKRCLEASGLKSAEGNRFKVRVQKNGQPRIEYDGHPESIPFPFRKSETTYFYDRDLVIAADEAKQLPPGFTVKYGTQLRIS